MNAERDINGKDITTQLEKINNQESAALRKARSAKQRAEIRREANNKRDRIRNPR